MEEDIKILQEILNRDIEDTEGTKIMKKAIENLIARYKELKEKYNNKLISIQKEREEYEKDYIPKSKVQEIIQENSINISGFWCIATDDLQELLED